MSNSWLTVNVHFTNNKTSQKSDNKSCVVLYVLDERDKIKKEDKGEGGG